MTNQPTEIDLAAHAFTEAKAAEARAHDARLAAEAHLIELVGLKDEGTTSTETDWYRISTVGKLTRTLKDVEAMPARLRGVIMRTKHALDVKALKALATADPDAYREACRFIVTKPAKPSARVELIAQVAA